VIVDSFDDLLVAIAEAREAADLRVLPFQEAIRVGDLCLSYHRGEAELFVFHQILDPLEGAEDEPEREYIRTTYADPDMRNYRFTRSYSEICPEGELGDIHVSVVSLVLPRSVWDQCRQWKWHGQGRIEGLLREHAGRIGPLTFQRIRDGHG